MELTEDQMGRAADVLCEVLELFDLSRLSPEPYTWDPFYTAWQVEDGAPVNHRVVTVMAPGSFTVDDPQVRRSFMALGLDPNDTSFDEDSRHSVASLWLAQGRPEEALVVEDVLADEQTVRATFAARSFYPAVMVTSIGYKPHRPVMNPEGTSFVWQGSTDLDALPARTVAGAVGPLGFRAIGPSLRFMDALGLPCSERTR